jgi:hypothetical protein
MSVLDQVRALEQQVLQRLRELRPFVAEHRELEKVAERLGLKRDDDEATDAAGPEAETRSARSKPSARRKPAATRRATRAATARGSKRAAAAKPKAAAAAKPRAAAKAKPKAAAKAKPSARKRTAAAPGQREQDVLRIVRERPGVTVAELGAELKVDATGLYGVVRRLQGRGQISKDGTRLRLTDASARTGEEAVAAPAASAGGSPAAPETPGSIDSEAAAGPAATGGESS